MKVLVITPEWPTPDKPNIVPFLVRQITYLRKHNIDIDIFHIKGNQSYYSYIDAFLKLRKIINKYDLIHCQWGYTILPVIFSRKTIITTFRGGDLGGICNEKGNQTIKGYLLKFFSKVAALKSKELILVSPHMRKKLTFSKRPKTVIPSGLEFDKLIIKNKQELRKKYDYDPNIIYVLFPYNIKRLEKRYSLLKEALDLSDIKDRYKIENVTNVSHEEILERIQAVDFVILTSKFEGSPNIVKESLALNTPVVSVDVGDVKYRLKDISGCFVSKTDTAKSISEEINKASRYNYELYDSRKYVLDLDEEILIKKVINIYCRSI
ncbi:glycosyltransferase family 4 protein [bacterium]|nr:glycosyltransferase family 4 protein [bacterium]